MEKDIENPGDPAAFPISIFCFLDTFDSILIVERIHNQFFFLSLACRYSILQASCCVERSASILPFKKSMGSSNVKANFIRVNGGMSCQSYCSYFCSSFESIPIAEARSDCWIVAYLRSIVAVASFLPSSKCGRSNEFFKSEKQLIAFK